MTDYAPNYSNRYIIKYTAAGVAHKCSFRYGTTPGAPPAALVNHIEGVLELIKPKMVASFQLLDASYIPAGGTAEFPATVPTIGAPSATTATLGDAPRYAGFRYRGTDGTAGGFKLFGFSYDPGQNEAVQAADFRVTSAEDPDVALAIAGLNAASADYLTTISGATAIWRQWVSVRYSSYWQSRLYRAGL